MISNQNEFNKKYSDKEVKKIKITDEDFEESQLLITNYLDLKELCLKDIDSIDKVVLENLGQLQGCTI